MFDLKVTSAGAKPQTAAGDTRPLSVVQFGRVHWLLVFLLVVLGADQPLAGKVFEDDVVVAAEEERRAG